MVDKKTLDTTNAGSNWEADMSALQSKSARRAWIVAGVSVGIAALAVAALAAVMPLKTVVPHFVTLDKTTGAVEVIDVTAQKVAFSEIEQKYWASLYVQERETYQYTLLQKGYDNVLAWSTDDVAGVYAQQFSGGKDSKDKILGSNFEELVNVISVSLPPNAVNKMIVRYELSRRRTGTQEREGRPRTFVASMAYKFEPAQRGSSAELIRNPLGFRVTAYRLDEEISREQAPVAAAAPVESAPAAQPQFPVVVPAVQTAGAAK
jgi:type IV secretion system protein VirB8